MQFTVPKFIEHEPKVVGPLTFRQFIYVGAAGAISFVLYFSTPFYIFLLGTLILMGGALALAFVTIEGRSLPEVVKNFFMFSAAPKIFLWKRKFLPPKLIIKKAEPEKIEEVIPPKIGGERRLQKLATQIETKTK